MPTDTPLLQPTRLLDFTAGSIQDLIDGRGWRDLDQHRRIGAAYDFVRNQIRFGYNRRDDIRASDVLADGYGQCNTKATLLMALLRGLDVPCRLHGFTIHKALQRGVVPEAVYALAPAEILHSWVEVRVDGRWVNLEGFILDADYLAALQTAFPDRQSLCGYGVGTDDLGTPQVAWRGGDTYIQRTGIARDLGLYDDPDTFYRDHRQAFGPLRDWLYSRLVRHWMNARVGQIRGGRVPSIPDLPAPHTVRRRSTPQPGASSSHET
ncbi:transglutaminase-like domain-containing protein [Roseivivax isoporae]|uniref:Transglutaminase n=1 Tax=Roseivivax isoporae LMG 25204 TaxID=1449351 RepID=X7F1X9_9RHOB|nr:transglutaminase family protein [Roseivivax isoporae]ETX26795.1 transglutaminase [Roseivivax isoporae LMG 25204]